MPDFVFYHHGTWILFLIGGRPSGDRQESRLRNSYIFPRPHIFIIAWGGVHRNQNSFLTDK